MAIIVIINCSIVLSPHTLSNDWIAMTNARALLTLIKFQSNEMYQCLLIRLPKNELL